MNMSELDKIRTKLIEINSRVEALAAEQKRTKPEGGKYWIGDGANGDHVLATIHQMITDRPRTMREIVELSGVRQSRCSSAIVQMQMHGTKVLNLGTKYRAIWAIRNGR